MYIHNSFHKSSIGFGTGRELHFSDSWYSFASLHFSFLIVDVLFIRQIFTQGQAIYVMASGHAGVSWQNPPENFEADLSPL